MLESWVASLGLKLNELAGFETGPGVILLALKDGGKKASGISYGDLRAALRSHLGPRLGALRDQDTGADGGGAPQAPDGLSVDLHDGGSLGRAGS